MIVQTVDQRFSQVTEFRVHCDECLGCNGLETYVVPLTQAMLSLQLLEQLLAKQQYVLIQISSNLALIISEIIIDRVLNSSLLK